MAFDGMFTKAVATHLNKLLAGGRIDKVYHPDKEELLLHINSMSGKLKLFATVSSHGPRVHLTNEEIPSPAQPSAFCMLLRKHLQGGRIISIEQVSQQRVIAMDVAITSELGLPAKRRLYFEIMGKHSNIILVDQDTGTILESIKRISLSTSRVRPIFPGLQYIAPPAQNKIDYTVITKEQFDVIPKDEKSMLSSIGGISPAIARLLASSDSGFDLLETIVKQQAQDQHQEEMPTYIFRDAQGKYMDFHVVKLPDFPEDKTLTFPDPSLALWDFYFHKASANRINQQSSQLNKVIQSRLDKLMLKVQKLWEDLFSAQNSEHLRLYGELLTANLHLLKGGEKEITVSSYYDGTLVSIPLDPKYSAAKNAQLYFKKYSKAKNSIAEKKAQITEAAEEITYLQSVATALEQAADYDQLAAIKEELRAGGYLKKQRHGHKEKSVKPTPLKLKAPSGALILVGRNNKENDYITTKLADSCDLWLHTKDIPGSHVLLKSTDNTFNPSDEDIRYASSVAAYYSKGRNSDKVPVDYVQAKYVKKPNKARPGMVIFTDNKTIWALPQEPQIVPEQ